jgi:hypothetical protein
MPARIEITRAMFSEQERLLCSMGEFAISAFRYGSGIEALRIRNARGEIIVLPFKGQQIWRAVFDGRDLTMKSMFDEPVATTTYLETYGAFFIHCGLTGMGAPGPSDRHPLHGELPNAPFQDAWLVLDETGGKISVGGSYQYTVAFATNYLATAHITLPAGSALFDVSLVVENLKKTPMDLMYLAHANFRPADHGVLHYSAPYTAEAVRVRRSIPSHVAPTPGYPEFLAALASDPVIHHRLEPGLAFDPEVVFTIDMKADSDGFAHALQLRPDGTGDYIRYLPAQAPICMRWICRTPDQDAIGMAFPSTSEVEGHAAEKAKGQVVVLAGGDTWRVDMRMGLLDASETAGVIREIERIRAG